MVELRVRAEDIEELGYRFAKGVFRWLACWLIVPAFILSLAWMAFGLGMDDSDTSAWERSGVSIVTDAKTGLQYLKTADGGITPRLKADGHQVQKGEEQ